MSESRESIYEHKPLSSPRSIRIIKLKGTHRSLRSRLSRLAPAADEQPQPLEVELDEVSLDSSSPLSYEALSYTWDGQKADRSIKCHGRTMLVTRNCEMALFGLRTKSTRCLWIDSICINQKSVAEKNTQVPLMGEIYGKCSKVLVWLGKATEASDQALQYLRDISGIVRQMAAQNPTQWMMMYSSTAGGPDLNIPPNVMKRIEDRRKIFRERNKQIYGREGTPSSNMLSDIFSRLWFSRMWTVQELVLGHRALIVCGNQELPWADFVSTMVLLARIEQSASSTAVITNDAVFFPKLQIYQQLRGHVHPALNAGMVSARQQDARKMSAILTMLHPLSSWDPRDKLYALHACFGALGIRDLPPVDYNLPVAQVYGAYARATMVREQSLDLLYALDHKRSVQGLASWSPDWSSYGSVWKICRERFAATGDSKASFMFAGPEDGELHLAGVVIATIKHRPSLNLPPRGRDSGSGINDDHRQQQQDLELLLANMTQQVQTWQEWARLASSQSSNTSSTANSSGYYQPTNQTWPDAFLRTMLQDGVTGPLPHQVLPAEVLDEFWNWIGILFAYAQPDDDPNKKEIVDMVDEAVKFALARPAVRLVYFPEGGVGVEQQQQSAVVVNTPAWRIMMAINYGGARAINAQIFEKTAGRTFFVTEAGYMGTGSELIRAGDLVVLVAGMTVPMIMRSESHDGGGGTGSNSYYSLVCPAYVHGVMNGEKWPANGEGLINLTIK
ncbi:heterokaryon incompatibility protein-domain-containing protein [Apodospora peruviana]|uniref:Heterokaryon incompatibility protein-domain-containing protein n=1 Tax=Apodospora peruviana TaxID=516989 RepID=A0AAE0M2K6_9PEZI|nr:heterokaryon incompatibility protein-domain-containing protein [Apodospora peruviana]